MSMSDALLPEFDHEMANTRNLLERVPDARSAWRPHSKSWTLGELATHLANLPSWATLTLARTELDLNPPGGPAFPPPRVGSASETLQTFDANVRSAHAAIAAATDDDMVVAWTLKNGGAPVMTLPRLAVLRSFVMNHLIHHRAS